MVSSNTPAKKNAARQAKEYPTVSAIRDALYDELEPWKEGEAAEYAQKFADSQGIENADVDAFLQDCPLYIDGEWKALKNVTSESKVQHGHATEILNTIIDHFHKRPTTRRAVVTSGQYFKVVSDIGHWEGGTRGQLRFSPDCMIIGCGGAVSPSTTLPSGEAIQYTDCITPVELKFDKEPSDDHAVQVGVYSREDFRQCHNREHVYGLLLTENWVQLIIYDRHGLMRSAKVDIHKDAATFIRIVAGVSSPDDNKVGYSECIRWENGVRVLRLPKLYDASKLEDGKPVELQNEVFRILPYKGKIQPFFIRNAIRSRGTTCWYVQDAAGTKLVAKFAWRFDDRTPEWDLLRDAKGLPGVAQLYAFCDCLAKISQKRFCILGDRDGTLSCVLMATYGGSVEVCGSPRQLLCAIHDAAEGHMNLFLERETLHRDISTRNVLMGNSEEVGWRGVIIDLDLAIRVNRGTKVSAGFRTGTRAFQSVRVLEGKPHDYWDDLESFFYVLTWTLASSRRNSAGGIEAADTPETLTKWDVRDDEDAAHHKLAFLNRPAMSQPFLSQTAAQDFLQLIDLLKSVVKTYQDVKEAEEAEYAQKQGGQVTEYMRTVDRADIIQEYNKFLQPIRNEISRLDLGLPPPSSLTSTDSSRNASMGPLHQPLVFSSQGLVAPPHGPSPSNSASASSSQGSKRRSGSESTQPSKRTRSSALKERSHAGPLASPSAAPAHATSSTRSRKKSVFKASTSSVSKIAASSSQRGRSAKKVEKKQSRSALSGAKNNDEENGDR